MKSHYKILGDYIREVNVRNTELKDLDLLDGWGDNVKTMQANWIGKSEGAIFRFPVVDAPNGEKIVKRNLNINDDGLIYYNISLSNNGIITGLLSNNQKTSIVWWRTDNIIANFFVE